MEQSTNSMRDVIRNMLYVRLTAIHSDIVLDKEKYINLSRDLERSCCNLAVRDCIQHGLIHKITYDARDHCTVMYSGAAARIADMLRAECGELYNALVTGRVRAIDVAQTPSHILCPSVMQKERDIVEQRSNQHIEINVSSLYKCSKCGMRRTTYDEYQTRSSDEAPTLAIRCINCGHAWTQHT
jgi:DNA-directed RNA polymerase subunit M/transcription elongation factor TFIIS